MKIAVNLIRIFVGSLFIFSGLVKANDPLGTAYKMEEYFEVWNRDLASGNFFLKNALINFFHFLNDHTLFLSITMNAFEIIAGAALLLGWRMKLFSWLLLVLMILFTILTGYTYKTGQPTNCGCFGDCIKITPQFSFYKDVLLSALILIILFTRKYIKPLFTPGINTASMFAVTVFSFGLQWYSLRYLPPVDCLPFKKGNSIPEKMKLPPNAVPDIFETRLVYKNVNTNEKKNMSQDEFNTSKIWEDSLWKWDTTLTKLVKKGKNNEPPIRGFSLVGPTILDTLTGQETKDITSTILSLPQVLLFFNTELPRKTPSWKNDLLEVYTEATKKGIPFYFVYSDRESAINLYSKHGFTNPQGLSLDPTAIRTAARSNHTLYLLKQGNIAGKWSYAKLDDAKQAIIR
ncbi:MAG TPA: BT_3928 family protein [Chitinophagaceae bacterium]|nr:BT_3928 family protein [Chitinophagaceae bacterium]